MAVRSRGLGFSGLGRRVENELSLGGGVGLGAV